MLSRPTPEVLAYSVNSIRLKAWWQRALSRIGLRYTHPHLLIINRRLTGLKGNFRGISIDIWFVLTTRHVNIVLRIVSKSSRLKITCVPVVPAIIRARHIPAVFTRIWRREIVIPWLIVKPIMPRL